MTEAQETNLGVGRWVAILLVFFGGVALFMTVVIYGLAGPSSERITFEAPGRAIVQLPAAGSYVLYHEFPRTQDSQGLQRPEGSELIAVTLTNERTGARIEVDQPETRRSYTIRRRFAESIREFTVGHAGTFRFETDFPRGTPAPDMTLVALQPYPQRLARTAPRALGVLLGTALLISLLTWRPSRKTVSA